MRDRTYFISTGAKNGFYTLRMLVRRTDERGELTSEHFIKSLSTSWDKAVTKAQGIARDCPLIANQFELDEILREEARWPLILEYTDPAVVPFGKHYGRVAAEVVEEDPDYMGWMHETLFESPCKFENIPHRVHLAMLFEELGIELPAARRARIEAERAAQDAEAAPVPVTNKRITVTGTVLTVKWQDSYYGGSYKMLVRDVTGFKLWGSLPNSLSDCGVGDTVQFDAAVEPSKDDEKFGFYKRPTKASILHEAEDHAVELTDEMTGGNPFA